MSAFQYNGLYIHQDTPDGNKAPEAHPGFS